MSRIKELAAYVRNNVEFFEERLQLALNKMDRMRCPLRVADYELACEIETCVADWADENGYDIDFLEGIDVDEIVMSCTE